MLPDLHKIKGLHPGLILRRALHSQRLKGSELAASINEHKQTISAILNQRRGINPSISIKLSKKFNVDEDYFMLLQASYDVKCVSKNEIQDRPNLSNFRKIIFWDTDINTIDWNKNKRAIIQRILERGNEQEINEIIKFYGKPLISIEINEIKGSRLASYNQNIKQYNL